MMPGMMPTARRCTRCLDGGRQAGASAPRCVRGWRWPGAGARGLRRASSRSAPGRCERLAWKLDLIARVEQRVHAPRRSPRPGPAQWPRVNARDDEYRRVRAQRPLPPRPRDRWCRPRTELGGGYWLLTPLRTADGRIVLVNRGFVPPAQRSDACGAARPAQRPMRSRHRPAAHQRAAAAPSCATTTRPPTAGIRATSQAIAAGARRWATVAPYFVDADAAGRRRCAAGPVGGLTVISFPNNHLVYALTWYALALMVGRRWPGSCVAGSATPADARHAGTSTAPMAAHRLDAPADVARGRPQNMLQLIQLRWIAVVGQVATIAVVHSASASACR